MILSGFHAILSIALFDFLQETKPVKANLTGIRTGG